MAQFRNSASCLAESRCRTRRAASDEWDIGAVVSFFMLVTWLAAAEDQ